MFGLAPSAGTEPPQGRKFTSFTTKEGLSSDFVISIYEESEGSLWIGTLGGGLNRFSDGKFTTFIPGRVI